MRLFLSFLLALFIASPVFAAKAEKQPVQEQAGGFEGPVVTSEASTVAQALKMPDDARIKLKGNLVSRLEDEKNIYIFKDASGQMEVRITPKQFQGQTIRPETPIQLTGRVSKSDNPDDAPRIKVNSLKILN